MKLRHTDRLGVGDVIVEDDGSVSVDGVAQADALVFDDNGILRVDLDGDGTFEANPPEAWEPDKEYSPGAVVAYQGDLCRVWEALGDVAVGYAPDDKHTDTTGGWKPHTMKPFRGDNAQS